MKTRFLPVALATVVLTLSACGGSGAPSQPKGPISEDRTAAFKSMMPEVYPHGQNGQRRRALRRWEIQTSCSHFCWKQQKPFTLFESDPQGNGRALPAIWTDTATFKAEEEKFVAAVEKLNAAPKPANWKKSKPLTAKPVQAANLATTHSAVRNKA